MGNHNEDYEGYDTYEDLESFRSEVYRIFARKYKDRNSYYTARFKEIWNSNYSDEMPWEALEKYNYDYLEEEIDYYEENLCENCNGEKEYDDKPLCLFCWKNTRCQRCKGEKEYDDKPLCLSCWRKNKRY